MNCCNQNDECTPLEGIVTVDERGQLVLPKELRDKWGLKSGEKLAVMTSLKGGEICCVTMVKADLLTRNFELKFNWIHEKSASPQTSKK